MPCILNSRKPDKKAILGDTSKIALADILIDLYNKGHDPEFIGHCAIEGIKTLVSIEAERSRKEGGDKQTS